jgi:hypothetical protein
LNEATHDVDGRIMAVKQGRSGNNTNWAGGCCEDNLFLSLVRHAPSSRLWFINSRVDSRAFHHG